MSISTYIALQSSVGSLLSLMGKSLAKVPVTLQNSVNYLYRDEVHGITAVDIRSKVPAAMFNLMAEKLIEAGASFDRFIMLTPYHPNPYEVGLFRQYYKAIAPKLEWQTVEQFARDLGVNEEDAKAIVQPGAAEKLKNAELAAKLQRPEADSRSAPVESGAARPQLNTELEILLEDAQKAVPRPARRRIETPMLSYDVPLGGAIRQAPGERGGSKSERVSRILHDQEPSALQQDPTKLSLVKKMPAQVFQAFAESGKSPEAFFRFGEPVENAIIVFTDIKNFSELVKHAEMQDLHEHLYQYYKRSKELLREHGGVLDKFIGDSVLAVFNYPQNRKEAYARAVRFGVEMVALGEAIFNDLAERMNHMVKTGTRVGIDTGCIWVLNIGEEELELSFVGDTINLASRLEKQCEVDGVLFSQRMAHELSRRDRIFFDSLEAVQRVLQKEQVKGQYADVKGWQLMPSQTKRLATAWAAAPLSK